MSVTTQTQEKTYHKPLSQVIDDQIQKGGSWKKIMANIHRVASRRNMQGDYSKNAIIRHIKKRLDKDPNYFGGEIEITDKKVQVKD